MIRLGEIQTLRIIKKVDFGVYLYDGEDEAERVLLPIKQVPMQAQVGDEVEVFLYRDSKDRLITTTARPKLTLHHVARLKVAQVGKVGAFLDWGLEKELLLPYREQTRKVSAGNRCIGKSIGQPGSCPGNSLFGAHGCLVALYIDKSDRLCATMNVYPYLSTESPYRKEDRVKGTVYEISRNFGAFVAVDDQYSGLIPQRELYGPIQIGDTVTARVTEVKEDGKLDLSIREKAYLQIEKDAQRVLEIIDSFDGALPFTDKASPEVIKRETQMSKNEFKRAVGHLLKAGRIQITERAIRLNRTE